MLCLHHNDADGLCAGAIVKRRFGDAVDLHEIDYGQPIPWAEIEQVETIIITDFSLTLEDMSKIAHMAGKTLIWIDHHLSAINQRQSLAHLPGLRKLDEAACVLTWQYFFPDQEIPLAVKLIGDRDIWRFRYPQTKIFCEGLHSLDLTPHHNPLWEQLLNDDQTLIQSLLTKGQILLEVRLKEIARRVDNYAFATTFHGYKTLAVNLPGSGDIGHYMCGLGYDIAYVYCDFQQDESLVTGVTLYSDTIDVSKIAQLYGGGGHKGAAGFRFTRTTDTPFPAILN